MAGNPYAGYPANESKVFDTVEEMQQAFRFGKLPCKLQVGGGDKFVYLIPKATGLPNAKVACVLTPRQLAAITKQELKTNKVEATVVVCVDELEVLPNFDTSNDQAMLDFATNYLRNSVFSILDFGGLAGLYLAENGSDVPDLDLPNDGLWKQVEAHVASGKAIVPTGLGTLTASDLNQTNIAATLQKVTMSLFKNPAMLDVPKSDLVISLPYFAFQNYLAWQASVGVAYDQTKFVDGIYTGTVDGIALYPQDYIDSAFEQYGGSSIGMDINKVILTTKDNLEVKNDMSKLNDATSRRVNSKLEDGTYEDKFILSGVAYIGGIYRDPSLIVAAGFGTAE